MEIVEQIKNFLTMHPVRSFGFLLLALIIFTTVYFALRYRKFLATEFGQTRNELMLMTWPTARQVGGLLLYTLIVCGIITLMILGLDQMFRRLSDILLNL